MTRRRIRILFPTGESQEEERERLFGIIEELVKWENSNDEAVLEQARVEIRESWFRACIEQRWASAGEGAVRPGPPARIP